MSNGIPILLYHSVSDDPPARTWRLSVHPDAFGEQLRWLARNGFTPVTFSTAAELLRVAGGSDWPERPVVLSFDDGYADFKDTAWPLLDRHGFTATVFVTTGWLADAGRNCAGRPLDRMLDFEQVRFLDSAGIEIGGHGHSHAPLDNLTEPEVLTEIVHSRTLLEECIGGEITAVAYPFGYSNATVRRAARDVGYRCAAAVGNVRATAAADPYRLPRLTVRRNTTADAFAELAGGSRTRPPVLWRDRAMTAGWSVVRALHRRTRRNPARTAPSTGSIGTRS